MMQNSCAPERCALCPRQCGADRRAGIAGYCGAGGTLRAARAALHYWEEPCISGTQGSGTVFFSGCTLKCCYCQNYDISAENFGADIDVRTLADIFLRLQKQGALNINLVTAAPWQPWIVRALELARAEGLTLPVVNNTGGYETVEAVESWKGYTDIWLTDWKYDSPALARELSAAADYPQVVQKAVHAMLEQVGAPQYDENGILRRGVIIRHLVLPGHADDSIAVLKELAKLREECGGGFIPSIMSQFTPFYKAKDHGLNRRITSYEYRKVIDAAIDLGLTDGFMQEKSSAREEYTPCFDLTGITPESGT